MIDKVCLFMAKTAPIHTQLLPGKNTYSLRDKAGLRVLPGLAHLLLPSLNEQGAKLLLLAPFYGKGR